MFLLRQRWGLSFLLIFCFIHQIVGPPTLHKVKDKDEKEKKADIETNEISDPMLDDEEFNLEYKRYLNEVVGILETDEEFKKNIDESMKRGDTRQDMSAHLHTVNRYVRSKLDELKRQEVERLRSLILLKDPDHKYPVDPSLYAHIDHFNVDSFGPKDLENLITKASEDLDKISKLKHEAFKQYEMEKHFEEEQKLKNMTEPEREKYKKELEEMKKKHADHPKVHHPGSKAQLEEVWDKQDHLEHQEFNPKTFFHLHDLDGNGYWDIDEVNALFIKELDKLYQSGLPEDDMRERQEEMELMREHVFKEADTNHDNMISLAEYLEMTNKSDFNKDEGWETLENKEIYSQREYEEFQRRMETRMNGSMDKNGVQGYHPQGPMDPGHHPQYQYHPNDVQYHPGNQPQYHPGNQPQYHPGNQPQYHHPNQPPPQYHQQVPQQAYHPNQVPQQQQYHPNQVPQQQQYHPNQVPQQQQYHPNQVPQQQQYHPNQVPQQQQYQAHSGQQQQQHQQVHSGQQQQPYQPHSGQQQQNHPNQVPQQQHSNQVPQQQQQQQQPNQVPQYQQQPGHVVQPQGQVPNNQVPQQQQQNTNQQGNQAQPPVNSQNQQNNNVPVNSNQQQGYQQNQNYPSHVNPPV